MIFNKQSIRQKLEAIVLTTAAAVLLLSFLLFMMIEINSSRDDAETRLNALATVLGANSSAAITFRDKTAATEVLSTLQSQADILEASIINRSGEILAKYKTNESIANTNKIKFLSFLLDNVEIEQPIIIHNELIGHFHIISDMSRAHGILVKQAALGLGIFIISMLVAMILSRKLQHIISDPIENLLRTITTVASDKNLSHRAVRTSNDELGTLVNEFNAMLDKLQDYDHELTDYRLDLERLVIERTRNLESAINEAKAADQAKSDFLATMSHEIRTPMNAVIGFAGLLKQTTLNEIQAEYVHNINSSTESLLTIINDILDFSKIEAGKLSLEESDFILKNEIDDIHALFIPKIEEKGLSLNIEIDSSLPLALYGDASRLRQILVNLLANAIKFTEQGHIKLTIDLIDKPVQPNQEISLRIIIEDTGIGITEEQQAQLFQPFQQGDASITRQYGGTGLGLVITQRLVTMMNGSIALNSTLGQGTSFIVTLCIHTAKEPDKIRARESNLKIISDSTNNQSNHSSLSNLSVLVVDDNVMNLKVASTFLNNEGAKVTSVESGHEALLKAEKSQFNLILMDLEMPGMSGIETATKIRQLEQYTDDTPIIALTAHAFPDIRKQVQDAGMNDLLAKPYKPEQLFSIISKWCHTSRSQLPIERKTIVPQIRKQTYNYDAALSAVAGDKKVAEELLNDFLIVLDKNISLIQNAIETDSNDKLYELIHKLAGSACVVGADSLHGTALELMDMLKTSKCAQEDIKQKTNNFLLEINKFQKLF